MSPFLDAGPRNRPVPCLLSRAWKTSSKEFFIAPRRRYQSGTELLRYQDSPDNWNRGQSAIREPSESALRFLPASRARRTDAIYGVIVAPIVVSQSGASVGGVYLRHCTSRKLAAQTFVTGLPTLQVTFEKIGKRLEGVERRGTRRSKNRGFRG